jgi:serine/threonine protein kinase
MELASGGELYDFLIHSGVFSENIARKLFIQLMAGILHCHSKGIAHRDLKLENILLDNNYNLKIADFGFAG